MSIAARRLQRSLENSEHYGPVSYASLAIALTALHAPSGGTYITWDEAWPNDLEYVMEHYVTGVNDILVLPERVTPYYIESANGFMYTSTVQSWSDGALVVHNSRLWGEMCRVRRGILGLGPGAVLALKPSSFTQAAQGNSTTRYYTTNTGSTVYEVGCMEKVLGCAHSSAYFGNFTVAPSLDFGGVAYNFLGWSASSTSDTGIFENLYFQGSHRGFAGAPNGETAAIGINKGAYSVYNCEVDCRLPDGTSVGTSPIMLNSSVSGLIQSSYFHHSNLGMPTHWNCSGTHTMNNVRSEYMVTGPGWNLEKNLSGVTYNFNGGSLLLGSSKFQLNIGGYASSAKINCTGVTYDLSQGYWPGYVSIQTYASGGVNNQLPEDITIVDDQGVKVPAKGAFDSGIVTL